MPKCIASVEASEAAIFRAISAGGRVSAFDEFDSILADDDKAGAALCHQQRSHARTRCACAVSATTRRLELFATFAAKAIGMCRPQRAACNAESSASMSNYVGARKDEHVEKFEHIDDNELADLRGRLRRWALDNEDPCAMRTPSNARRLKTDAPTTGACSWPSPISFRRRGLRTTRHRAGDQDRRQSR